MSTCCVSGVILTALGIISHMILPTLYTLGTIVISISQAKKEKFRGTERLYNLSKVTQMICGDTEIWAQAEYRA